MPGRPPAPSGRARRGAAALLLVLVALVLVGCRTTARVDVAVRPDGSGTVTVTATLDAEAARALGDPSLVSLADLRTAGWSVSGPDDAGGGLRWVVRRRFDSPAGLRLALDEVGGPDGVFRGTRLAVSDGFGSTSYDFRTRLRLTGELSQLSDPALAEALGGVALGWTPEELAAAGASAPGAAQLVVSVDLPGGAPTTDGRVVGGRATWVAPLTGGRATVRSLTSSSVDGSPLPAVLVVAGAVLLVAAGVVLVVSRRRGATTRR